MTAVFLWTKNSVHKFHVAGNYNDPPPEGLTPPTSLSGCWSWLTPAVSWWVAFGNINNNHPTIDDLQLGLTEWRSAWLLGRLKYKWRETRTCMTPTLPFISLRAALAASSVVYSRNAYPLDLLEILSIIILTARNIMPLFQLSGHNSNIDVNKLQKAWHTFDKLTKALKCCAQGFLRSIKWQTCSEHRLPSTWINHKAN